VLFTEHCRRRFGLEQVTGRDASGRGADQDRALQELVPPYHVDARRLAWWAQQLNRRNETQLARIQSKSVRPVSLQPQGWSMRRGFSDTPATVLARVISRICLDQHLPLLLSRFMGLYIILP